MLVYPNAKINIGLNIVEKRPDGYHNIETIFYPIPLQDALEITSSQVNTFKMEGNELDCAPDENLVIKIRNLIEANYHTTPVNIFLYKHIPSGAGLGGGSSDAAFMLKALNTKFNLGLSNEEMRKEISSFGADCAFFIENKPVYATGIGNVFEPISLSLKDYTIILIKPDVHISTKKAYASIHPHASQKNLTEIICEPIETWKEQIVNDFESSIFPDFPEVAAIKDKLYDLGAVYASMSGSGSTIFGLFKSPIEHVEEIFPNYFVRQRQLTI